MLGIPCTLVVGTHIWCSHPQLLAWLMLRFSDASMLQFGALMRTFSPLYCRLFHFWRIWEICRNQSALLNGRLPPPFPGWQRIEVNDMTEKWCRCNVSRLNGVSVLCLSQCSCLRTLLTSANLHNLHNLQNADKEWALVMLTVCSFVN